MVVPRARFAIHRMHLATRIRLAHLAAFFAAPRDANIHIFAAVANLFHVLHLAHHVADFVAVRFAAALRAFAIAAIVAAKHRAAQGKQNRNVYEMFHGYVFVQSCKSAPISLLVPRLSISA